jgi:hypothetical protein
VKARHFANAPLHLAFDLAGQRGAFGRVEGALEGCEAVGGGPLRVYGDEPLVGQAQGELDPAAGNRHVAQEHVLGEGAQGVVEQALAGGALGVGAEEDGLEAAQAVERGTVGLVGALGIGRQEAEGALGAAQIERQRAACLGVGRQLGRDIAQGVDAGGDGLQFTAQVGNDEQERADGGECEEEQEGEAEVGHGAGCGLSVT